MPVRRRQARRQRPRLARLPGIWLGHHLQGALASLGRLTRSPLPTFMTVAVIGIALALPAGLYALTRNMDRLSGAWEQSAAISLFLRTEVTVAQAEALGEKLRARGDLIEVRLITPEKAIEDLRAQGDGFAEAIDQLDANPLPAVLAMRPAPSIDTTGALEALSEELAAAPEADFARLDTQWVRRFQAIVALTQRVVLLLAGILGLGVLLVVGNTIRLEIENRRAEVQIMEQVGATPGFIRRPFLYLGAWYGLLGGIAAWLLIVAALWLLQGPVSRLAELYQTQFGLLGLGPGEALALLAGSVLLGLAGGWLSVSRHLAAVDPR
jgi:cell division transport system permease protein